MRRCTRKGHYYRQRLSRIRHGSSWFGAGLFDDQALALSIGKPEAFVFTVRYERRNRAPQWLVDLEKIGPETGWPLAELSLDLTTRHNLRIRAGAEKGGLVCTGGVCRFEEPFKGVKLVLTSIF